MKFYISAKWQIRDKVELMQNYFRDRGHEITSLWTDRAYARDYGNSNERQSDQYSEEEIQVILGSDVLIHLSDQGGKGKYVDLGIALAGNKLQKKPQIYVVGKAASESQFYFNRAVKRIVVDDPINSLDQILQEIEK